MHLNECRYSVYDTKNWGIKLKVMALKEKKAEGETDGYIDDMKRQNFGL